MRFWTWSTPYVFETITSRDRPRAASQAANTRRIMGIMLARIKWELRIVTAMVTNRDNIIPSRHSREDIKWDRYINRPSKEIVNAKAMFM